MISTFNNLQDAKPCKTYLGILIGQLTDSRFSDPYALGPQPGP